MDGRPSDRQGGLDMRYGDRDRTGGDLIEAREPYTGWAQA